MQRVVTGDNLRVADRQRAAAISRYEAARLAHQQATGSGVPRREIAFPETVIAAGSDPREVERGRAEPANSGNLRAYARQAPGPFIEVAMPVIGNARGDQRFPS